MDAADVAAAATETMEAAQLLNVQRQLEKKVLKPVGRCYGCGEDFIVDGQAAPFFAQLGFSKEQMLEKLFCPNSAEECDGYYQVEQRQLRIGGRQ